jgi:hypothetical protein
LSREDFIEVYIVKQRIFIIIFLSHCLGGLIDRKRSVENLRSKDLTVQNEQMFLDLHLRMGSTVMLKFVGGARGAEGAGYVTRAGPELQHILQQQKRRNRHTMAPPIMAPGVVKVQWLVVLYLVMVSSL